MISVTLALLQSAALVPVPPRPPMILDHRIACNLFGTDAALGRIVAETVAESAALARLTMRGTVNGVPLPQPRASALSERGLVAVKSHEGNTEYSWLFSIGPASDNGVVTVSARVGMGPVRNVATGICVVTSTKAVYQ